MKLLRFLIFVLLINAVVLFCVLLNLKLAFGEPAQIKKLINQSGAYDSIAAAIRENIASVNPSIDQGNLLESLNDKVGPDGLRTLAEDLIDQTYAAAKNRNGQTQIVLHYSLLQSQLPGITLPPDTVYPINNNKYPFLPFMQNYLAYLGGIGLFMLVFLALHLKCIGRTRKEKLKWLGISFLFITLELVALILVIFYVMPGALNQILEMAQLENQKIAIGITKAIDLILNEQRLYYYTELVAAALVTFFSLVISKAIRENPTTINYRK